MAKADLLIAPPYTNAAGTLGFAPDLHAPVCWSRLGAFVTNPISLEPRQPANSAACLAYSSGFLLHTGYPNPGIERAIQRWAAAWARSPFSVLVALLPQKIADIPVMVSRLEGLPGVGGVEIALPPGAAAADFLPIVHSAFGELAVIVRLPVDRAGLLVSGQAVDLLSAGLAAVSLGAPRGALPDESGRLVYGRLFGSSLFPQTLAAASQLVGAGLPVIAGPGVYSHAQAKALLQAGVLAVQLDAVLWKDPSLTGWRD